MWFLDPILFLFLLLPVAAFSGWVIGRRHYEKPSKSNTNDVPLDYIKGLNFFLNEQPDKAVDLFIQMLEVNRETVETHLALGNLFRRRGEVDRAIRVHQNLISRPRLSTDQRAHAMYELGQDYMRAGLLDRAEELFAELVEKHPRTTNALFQLIDIYQQERDWEKAIATARKMDVKTNKTLSSMVAHYHCELAEQKLKSDDLDGAKTHIHKALSIDPGCVRASILEGNTARRVNDYPLAIHAYMQIEKQDPDYLPEVLPLLEQCHQQLGNIAEFKTYLQSLLQRQGGSCVALLLADLIYKQDGEIAAEAFLVNELEAHPSVRGIDKLIEFNIIPAKEAVQDKLTRLKAVTAQLLKNNPIYKCKSCGFSSRVLYWQCPGCRNWNTVKPLQGNEIKQ
jgi:lipopolysaccharide biosynthesis regulator YciM